MKSKIETEKQKEIHGSAFGLIPQEKELYTILKNEYNECEEKQPEAIIPSCTPFFIWVLF